MAVQSTYSNSRDLGAPGLVAHNDAEIRSVIVEGAIAAGLLVVHGTTTRTEGAPPSAPTAAPTAILATGGASAATAQQVTGSALNGAVGQGVISPPANITLVLSSHTDWDATTAVVTGEDEDGRVVEESFSIPNNGNATVTGYKIFSKVLVVAIPAQTGTNGTFTIGTGTRLGVIDPIVHGVSVYDASREPGVWPVDSAMPVIRKGVVWVNSETAVNPSLPVYARLVVTGNEVLGRFRSTPDSTDLGRLASARWLDITSGEGLARLAIDLP